jgi:seryl-tRNA synthetase
MHDIKLIRENPAAFDSQLARRGAEPRAAALLSLDEKWRALTTELQESLARRNDASKAIGTAKAQKRDEDAAALMAEVGLLWKHLRKRHNLH